MVLILLVKLKQGHMHVPGEKLEHCYLVLGVADINIPGSVLGRLAEKGTS